MNYDTELDQETVDKTHHDYEEYSLRDKPLEYIF